MNTRTLISYAGKDSIIARSGRHPGKNYTPPTDEIERLFNRGLNTQQIATRLNLSEAYVYNLLIKVRA
jgi:DNA-binding NarL/FixJ family response regulator